MQVGSREPSPEVERASPVLDTREQTCIVYTRLNMEYSAAPKEVFKYQASNMYLNFKTVMIL
jgi:hypothetical protein